MSRNPSPADEPIPVASVAFPYAGFHHSHSGPPRPRGTFLSAVFVAFWFVAAAVALGGFAGLAWLVSSKAFAAASPLLGVLLLIAVGTLARGVRRRRAVAALNYLEQAARLNLPLPPMLQAAEDGERGGQRATLRRLRERLEDGWAVSLAVDHTLSGLPPRATALIAAGEYNGRLAPALGRLVRDIRRAPQHDPSRAILMRWYPIVLVVALSAGMAFVSVFVMPKLNQLFRDFRMELPEVTVATTQLWLWLGPPLGVVMAVVALLITGRMVTEAVAPQWLRVNAGPLTYLPQWLAWWLPPARGVVRSRGLADLCHVLADAAEAGRPMNAALRDTAGVALNVVLRGRVEQWAAGVEAGLPVAQAAREGAMPPLLCDMLSTPSARGSADLPDVFRFLARYYDGRFGRASALLEGAAVPTMVLVFAFFVGSAALGLFLPLIHLINRMADLTGMN